jgi:hypothetical protein
MADNQTPWMMFRNELTSFLGGDAGQFNGLQTDTGVLPALWDDPNFGTWLGLETAGEIPVWGPLYNPQPGNHVEDAYHTFLTNIDAPAQDEAAADEAKRLSGKLNDALAAVNNLRLTIGPKWAIFNASQVNIPPEFQLSFADWFVSQIAPQLSVLQAQYDNVAANWVAASNKAGGGFQTLAQALIDYNNPAPGFQIDAKDNNGATLRYRVWSLLPDLKQFITEAQAGNGTALDLDINTHTQTTDSTHSSFNFTVGFNIGFFGLSGGGGHDRTTVDTHTQDFSMKFSAPAFTGIRVSPGPWFHQNVIQEFKNGPFIPGGPFGPGKALFFGPTGTYSLQKSIIYVAWHPTVTATLDQQAYSSCKTSYTGSGSLSIGPFTFGGGAGGSQDHAEFSDSTRTIKITSGSPHPQILATRSIVMPGN